MSFQRRFAHITGACLGIRHYRWKYGNRYMFAPESTDTEYRESDTAYAHCIFGDVVFSQKAWHLGGPIGLLSQNSGARAHEQCICQRSALLTYSHLPYLPSSTYLCR